MARFNYIFLITLSLTIPLNAWAATKNVTIVWTIGDTQDVAGYKMYFSYDSSMTDKQLACETDDATATSLTCPNVILVQSPVYFVIAAVLTDGEANSTPVSEAIVTGISMVQGFQLEISNPTAPPPGISHAINFQPADVPTPEGYLVDSGLPFDSNREYGWISGPDSLGTRDRNATASPDQAYDTMIHVTPTSVWEYSLPNGTYTVTICMGDPSYPVGMENLQIEGVTVISNASLSSSSPWIENTITVNVTDGRMTLTFNGSTDPARLCWLRIESAN
ncbi:hypothetical protein ACLG6S_04015 [Thermodesulfobacteriota bacterium B35]